MKKLIMLTIILTFTSLPTYASTGAEKFMAKLQENFSILLIGDDCEVYLHYNEETSISSGGPIRLDGKMELGNYEINPHIDIEKTIVSDSRIVTAWSNGFSSTKIVIDVAPTGRPLVATGSVRKGLFFEKRECKVIKVIKD